MAEENYIDLVFKEVRTANELFCQFDEVHGVLLLDVKNPFTQDDFNVIFGIIEPHFEKHGEMSGIIINAKKFPYWLSGQNRKEYIDFASFNHVKFKKAALVMGGFFTKIVARIARGRVHPEIKIFKYNKISEAQDWILGH